MSRCAGLIIKSPVKRLQTSCLARLYPDLPAAWTAQAAGLKTATRYGQPPGIEVGSARTAPNQPKIPAPKSTKPKLSRENAYYVKLYGMLVAVTVLGSVAWWTVDTEYQEFCDPTPPEWSFFTRQSVRNARAEIKTPKEKSYVDWARVGKLYLEALKRLENPDIDGKGCQKQEDELGGEIDIADVGPTGLDIIGKDWPWRDGYFQVLMGMARASEQMETMARDRTRNLIFPSSVVIGPSNPEPQPISPRMAEPPLEENCERPFDPPELFYMRIMTAKGFSTGQRMTAALAYANWLAFQGLDNAAGEMLKWAVDVAREPLSQTNHLLDPTTYIFRRPDSATETPSPNLLHAITALAVHRARTGDQGAALSMLLSVLRIRREAPILEHQSVLHTTAENRNFWTHLVKGSKWRDEAISGDQPYVRVPGQQDCDESELLMYIGELMYASSSHKDEGLVWTKRAVEVAHDNTTRLKYQPSSTGSAKDIGKCRQCLSAALKNWEIMLESAIAQESSNEHATPWIQRLSIFKRAEPVSHESDRSETLKSDLEKLGKLKLGLMQDMADEMELASQRAVPFVMLKG